jgi:sRNA-binding regulator protein Hfq
MVYKHAISTIFPSRPVYFSLAETAYAEGGGH